MEKTEFTLKVSNKDIIWGYLAQFFSIATGIIILPLMLKMLTPAEVGMNYLMISVGALAALVDFGFSPQFGRNITYIFSGAQKLLKNGVDTYNSDSEIHVNYKLLSTTIKTAKFLYFFLGLFVLTVMLSIGSFYIYVVTKGFRNVENSLMIWIVFSVYMSLQIYYSYYNAFLTGSGRVTESRKVIVLSNLSKILISIVLLLFGCGLLGVVLANLIQPFITRIASERYFFTKELKDNLASYHITYNEKISLFKILWSSSSKMGVCSISGYLTYGASTLLVGYFLTLDDVASYGLANQLIALISGVSGILFSVYLPRITSLKVTNAGVKFLEESSYVIIIYIVSFLIGILFLTTIIPSVVQLIGSSTNLPGRFLLFFMGIFRLLDGNYWNSCQLIIIDNQFPFIKSALISSSFIIAFTAFALYLGWGLWGIVISTGLIQLFYNDWYWILYFLKSNHSSFLGFYKFGVKYLYRQIINNIFSRL